MNCYDTEEKSDLQSQIKTSNESITNFFSSSATKIVIGDLDPSTSESSSVCTRSQTSRASTPAPEKIVDPPVQVSKYKPKQPSQPDFQIPNAKKPDMSKKGAKTKTDYHKMSSETPPSPSRSSSSGSLNKDPQEHPTVSNSLKQNEKKFIWFSLLI